MGLDAPVCDQMTVAASEVTGCQTSAGKPMNSGTAAGRLFRVNEPQLFFTDNNCGAPVPRTSISLKFNGQCLVVSSLRRRRKSGERNAQSSNPYFKVIKMAAILSNLRTDLLQSFEGVDPQSNDFELLFP